MTKSDLIKKIFYGDISVWVIFLLLCCLSLIEVFSATGAQAFAKSNFWLPIIKHTAILSFGAILVVMLSHIHYKFFSLAILLLPIAGLMLLITPFVGMNVHSSTRFLELFGFQFQPSEVAKFACVVYVAYWLSKRGKMSDSAIFKIILWGIIPVCVLIAYGNLSTAILLGVVCYMMMFIGHIPLKKLGKLLLSTLATALIVALLISVMPPDTVNKYMPRAATGVGRITRFLNPEQSSESKRAEDAQRAASAKNDSVFIITDDNYQINHAKIAIARGGILGKGAGQSVQRDVLPQAYSDFIYAIIIEELGIAGGLGVILLYIMLLIRAGIIARRCESFFPQYLVLGCGLVIVIQAFTNIAVTVGLFPVTGQPLPLICQGGTSTVMTCVYLGIILSISHFGAGMGKGIDMKEETEEGEGEGNDGDENENESATDETETAETADENIDSTVNRTDE
ncbi:MAG: FtsW/RodA/SpoVE family cell cycle protein [Tannerella sp.]|jgi:cell division protein FtsW|nr:FtsW/RodA/SpoVE family cell cycle protein [Tannerella sp.]